MNFQPRVRRGSRAPNASMTDAQVEAARELWAQDHSLKQIKARLELDCTLMTIWNAVNERTYKKRAVDIIRLSRAGWEE